MSAVRPTRCPIEVRADRSTTLALRWLVGFSRQRREKTMIERLMNEILDASNGLGRRRQAARGHPQDGRVKPAPSRTTAGDLATCGSAARAH